MGGRGSGARHEQERQTPLNTSFEHLCRFRPADDVIFLRETMLPSPSLPQTAVGAGWGCIGGGGKLNWKRSPCWFACHSVWRWRGDLVRRIDFSSFQHPPTEWWFGSHCRTVAAVAGLCDTASCSVEVKHLSACVQSPTPRSTAHFLHTFVSFSD